MTTHIQVITGKIFTPSYRRNMYDLLPDILCQTIKII